MTIHLDPRVALATSLVSLASLASAQSIERVSLSSAGGEGNGVSFLAHPSADGRYVAFESASTNLVAGDSNASRDIFVRDRTTGQTMRVSVSSSGAQGHGFRPGISADGRYVVFFSYSPTLVANDTNGTGDIFVHDRQTATTTRVSVSSNGAQVNLDCIEPTISGDGSRVSFASKASALVAGDNNGFRDVFVHDLATGQTICASVDALGAPADGESTYSSLSRDGRWVVFDTAADNAVPGGNPGGVILRDLANGVSVFVADGWSPHVSDDGRYVEFTSWSPNLVPGDTNGVTDVFVRDMQTGGVSIASVSSSGAVGNGLSTTDDLCHAVMTGDGRFVVFESEANNLVSGDDNGLRDVFVHDFASGLTSRVSLGWTGAQAGDDCLFPAISRDGSTVFFSSAASNLVAGDTNGQTDVFATAPSFAPAAYCTAATTTNGCTPTMGSTGAASASAASGFTLLAQSSESNRSGLFFYGLGSASAPFAPGNSSVMCVSAPRQRTALSNTGGPAGSSCDGLLALDWNAWRLAHPAALGAPFAAGLALYAQGWIRDPLAAGASNLSNGLVFVLGP